MPSPTSFPARRDLRPVLRATAVATVLVSLACASPRGSAADSASANVSGDVELAAGRTGGARIDLEVDRTQYAAGDTVRMRIISREDAGYGYNACMRTVEWRRSGEWFSVPEEGRMCTMNLAILAPGQTAEATTTLPETMRPGDYRVVITFSREESPMPGGRMASGAPAPARVASAPFRVE